MACAKPKFLCDLAVFLLVNQFLARCYQVGNEIIDELY
jgi:hypothetical protein